MAQAVEVHVGTTSDRNQILTLDIVFRNISLQAGKGQCTRRLSNAARIVKNIFNRAAQHIRIDRNNFVQQLFTQAEGFLAHHFNSRAV
ncbi:Uncharacterised protein [Mycobacteroides abscessus subsp. massiliense]|nr:Uncharacterised protein [Mycobacteroides abscessus subsp. massiliense]